MTTATVTTTTGTTQVRLLNVTGFTGSTFQVQGTAERAFWDGQKAKYEAEHKFTAASDLADMDRLLFLELLCHRATVWLSSGRNYNNEILTPVETNECRKVLRENSPLISTIKNDLGMTKSQRDREQYESVGKYIQDLKARAREHGVKREKELTKAICLLKELFALVGAYDRSDEVERQKLGLESEAEILDFVRKRMKPEFDRIDEYFRQNHQKFWVKTI